MSGVNQPPPRVEEPPPAEPPPPVEEPPPVEADPVLNEYPDESYGREDNIKHNKNNINNVGDLYGVAEREGEELRLAADLVTPRDRERWENNPDSRDNPE